MIPGFIFPEEGVSEARHPAPGLDCPFFPLRGGLLQAAHIFEAGTHMRVPFPLVLVSREGKLEVAGLPLVSRSAPQHCPDPLSSSVHPCRPQRTSLEYSRNDVLFTLKVSREKRETRWEGTADLPPAARACTGLPQLRPSSYRGRGRPSGLEGTGGPSPALGGRHLAPTVPALAARESCVISR